MAGWCNGSGVEGLRNGTGWVGRRMDSLADEFKIRLKKRGGKEKGVLTSESRSSIFFRCKTGMKEKEK
jgi:hypothetical protein